MTLRAYSTLTLCAAAILGVACGDSSSDPDPGPDPGAGGSGGESATTAGAGGAAPDPAQAAEQKLFAAMNTDDLAAAESIVDELRAVKEGEPDHDRNTFLLGSGSLWWLAESSRVGDGAAPVAAIPLIQKSYQELIAKDAAESPYAKAFLGVFLYDSGLDKEKGLALVDEAAEDRPLFASFLQMFVRRLVSATDPLTEEGIAAGYALFEMCAEAPLDPDDPDFAPHMSKATTEGEARFCWGTSRVPHGFEGGWLVFGDMLVKGGRLEAAKTAYENAQLAPNYADWPHKGELEERLSGDLAARHASYSDPDPDKWPPVGKAEYSCALCHNETQK